MTDTRLWSITQSGRVGVLYTSGSGFKSPCSNYAEMAQRQRNRLVSDRLGVQISFSALTRDDGVVTWPGSYPGDAGSNPAPAINDDVPKPV